MAIFTIETPDGRELDIEAPDEATAMQGAQAWVAQNPVQRPPDATSSSGAVEVWAGDDNPAPAPEGETSQMLGFAKGLGTAPQNFWKGLEAIPGVTEFLDSPAGRFGIANMSRQAAHAMRPEGFIGGKIAEYEAQGIKPGDVGETLGGIAGAAPFVALTRNPYLIGAAEGALLSDAETPTDLAMDTATGAAFGKVGDVALKGLGKVVSGVTDPAVRALADRGVKLTPGQALGGITKWVEDRASSYPIVGETIEAGRRDALETFNVGALNNALEKIGGQLPKELPAGHEAVEAAGRMIGSKYDELVPQISVQVDPRFVAGLRQVGEETRLLPDAEAAQFNKLLAELLEWGPDGVMSGRAFRRAEQKLGKEAASYGRSPDPDDQRMSASIRTLVEVLREGVERQNPGVGQELKNTHAAFRELLPAEIAAAKNSSVDGVFSPAALKEGSRQVDSSVRKRQSARGHAPQQEYAERGKKALAQLPNSGTADRMNLNPYALALGAMLDAGYKGAKGVETFALKQRSEKARALAEAIKKAGPAGAYAGGLLATQGE